MTLPGAETIKGGANGLDILRSILRRCPSWPVPLTYDSGIGLDPLAWTPLRPLRPLRPSSMVGSREGIRTQPEELHARVLGPLRVVVVFGLFSGMSSRVRSRVAGDQKCERVHLVVMGGSESVRDCACACAGRSCDASKVMVAVLCVVVHVLVVYS